VTRVLGAAVGAVAVVAVTFAPACRNWMHSRALCPGCNVVVISIDTLRADHVGAYGYPRPTTPRLDRFASRAVVFERAISQSAWTRPAHASMFTGLYPVEHGIVTVHPPRRLSPEIPTLATVLSQAGYRTAAFVGGGNLSAEFGFDSGFETYRSPGRRFSETVPGALAWIDKDTTRPFFLFVHGLDAHRPYRADTADRLALGLSAEPGRNFAQACHGRPDASVQPLIDQYDAAIHRADRFLGLLLDALDSDRLRDRTLVIVISDHGEEFREHGGCFHIRSLHREVVEVPLMMRLPGVPPRRVPGVVPASVALAPTVLKLVLGDRRALPGPSIASLVTGEEHRFEYVVSETSTRRTRDGRGGRIRSITGPTDKLIHWIDEGRIAYYDLHADPGEDEPLEVQRAEALRRVLDQWRGRHRRLAGVSRPLRLTSELDRQLRALGYVH